MRIYNRVVFDMKTMDVIEEDSFEYQGPLDLAFGGGSSSGTIEYPDYMEKIHVDWLTGGTKDDPDPSISQSVEATMEVALGALGNPYTSLNAFDPGSVSGVSSDSPIGKLQTEHDSAEALVDGLDVSGATGDYFDIITRAAALVDVNLVGETEIDNTVTAFENNQILRHLRSVGRFAASMADRCAGDTSQFVIGMAALESDFADNVDQFEANLRIQIKRDKQSLIDAAVKEMIAILQLKIGSSLNLVQLQEGVTRVHIASITDQRNRDAELDVRFGLWDMEVFQMGGNILAAISGAAHPNQGLSKFQSTLGGAASGAAIGTAVNPGVGTGVGAGIGALFGFLSG